MKCAQWSLQEGMAAMLDWEVLLAMTVSVFQCFIVPLCILQNDLLSWSCLVGWVGFSAVVSMCIHYVCSVVQWHVSITVIGFPFLRSVFK